MLFTTAVFLFAFLPLALAGFYAAPRASQAAAWLFLASVVFYGYWMPAFTLLLLGSIVANFAIGMRVARLAGQGSVARARPWLVVGVTLNLAALAYFKYFNFFVDNMAAVLGAHWDLPRVVLPIGISFFTFTQIAFLVDAYRGLVRDYGFVHYGLFVTYFPHLVAGPILHHAQMIPQFRRADTYRLQPAHVAAGLALLAIGLAKKLVFADGIAPYADAVFNPADAGHVPDLHESWLGACAYTLQLYFDFSGYTDMAIGLSWLFNIRLPINFDSPYRATSISDFWRRWHISLSTFLRDYLYIALGGNRRGALRRYANLALTMLLGGLWHGASWTFVFWGGLHGVYLVVNHFFRALCGPELCARLDRNRAFVLASWALTLLAVVVAWVFFRSASFEGALRILSGMAGLNPAWPEHRLLWEAGLSSVAGFGWCAALALVALVPRNSNDIARALLERGAARPPLRAFVASFAPLVVLLLALIGTARDAASAFIYFNF